MLNNADLGRLILRLTLGILLLFHGVHKLIHGIDGIEQQVVHYGLPWFFAYGVYIGEVVAPVLIITGVYARVGAGLTVVNMLVALTLVHRHELLALNGQGGWQLELQGFYLFTALTLLFLGAGRYRLHT